MEGGSSEAVGVVPGQRNRSGSKIGKGEPDSGWRGGAEVSLHKILFRFEALSWESIILVLPPPTCKAYPIAILVHDPLRNVRPPIRPPFSKPYTIQCWS